MIRGFQRQFMLLSMLAMSSLAWPQRLPNPGNITPSVALTPAAMIKPVTPPCAKSVEPFDVDDYDGPLNQLVARFSQRVDRATVHVPSHRSALKPCSMTANEKFRLFVDQEIDPINFVGATWGAGESQVEHEDRAFGQGAAGFGKRYGAELADNATGDFFGVFLYPSVFRQDPRYYRLGQGSVNARLSHALEHRFVATGDSGHHMFNFSEWFGTVSTKVVTNLYHPGNPRGFGRTASRVGFSIGHDMAWDVFREFWPEIAHKFKLPFRTHEDLYSGKPAFTPVPVRSAAPPAEAPVADAVH